jgi:hypothetical protein
VDWGVSRVGPKEKSSRFEIVLKSVAPSGGVSESRKEGSMSRPSRSSVQPVSDGELARF